MTPGPIGVDSIPRKLSESDDSPVSKPTTEKAPVRTAAASTGRGNVEQTSASEMVSLTGDMAHSTGTTVQGQNTSGNHIVSARSVDSVNNQDRMRAIADRLKKSSPGRLDEFMREARQGAAKGNLESVLTTWEVSLDYINDAPSRTATPKQQSSSLSSSFKKSLVAATAIDLSPCTRDGRKAD